MTQILNLHIEVSSCQSSSLQPHIRKTALDEKMLAVALEGGDSGPLELPALGLMTVVDLALYRSLEGELTPTICSADALLAVWLHVQQQAQTVLASSSAADSLHL